MKSIQIINTSTDGSTIDVILADDSEITLSPGQSVTDIFKEGDTRFTHVEVTGATDLRDAAEGLTGTSEAVPEPAAVVEPEPEF